jgi:secreted trypsin-like serine protease
LLLDGVSLIFDCCKPKTNFKFVFKILGRTQEGGKSANVLQELQLPIISTEQCKDNYAAIGKLISDKQFDSAVLCAGYNEGGKDSCQGDSGGPFMFPFNQDGTYYYYQVGIVSYGIGCARQV